MGNRLSKFRFRSIDELDLSDVQAIIDATAPGSYAENARYYEGVGIPVLLQSGEFPNGRVISPPLVQNGDGLIYRQGDCVLSGTIPIISAINGHFESIIFNVLTQYTLPVKVVIRDRIVHSVYPRSDLEKRLDEEFRQLGIEKLEVLAVNQVIGLRHYLVNLFVVTETPGSGLREMLRGKPRITVIDDLESTEDLVTCERIAARIGKKGIKPITVFGEDLRSDKFKGKVKLKVAIDYRSITALANLDSIRMLVGGMNGDEAMRSTDKNSKL